MLKTVTEVFMSQFSDFDQDINLSVDKSFSSSENDYDINNNKKLSSYQTLAD